MLRKNRDIKSLGSNPNKKNFFFNNGLYVISSRFITMINNQAHLFYFEGVPTALNIEGKDHGQTYAGAIAMHNLLIQLNPATQGGGESILGMIGEFFSDPRRIVMLILGGTVLWALWSSGWSV